MLLDDIADVLTSGGVAERGVDIFKSRMPAQPAAAVAVLYGGSSAPPVHAMAGSAGQALAERPVISVWTRACQPGDAAKRAQDAFFVLDGLGTRLINGVLYHSIYAVQSPFLLERDENDRTVFACNYVVTREPSTSS